MKTLLKVLFVCIMLGVSCSAFAQAKTTTTAPAATSPKSKQLCKTWQIASTEAWGVSEAATDAQKKDLFTINEDGSCTFIWLGTSNVGKWTIDKSNTWMKITLNDGSLVNIKVVSVSDSELKIDYKDKDDVHNLVTYKVN